MTQNQNSGTFKFMGPPPPPQFPMDFETPKHDFTIRMQRNYRELSDNIITDPQTLFDGSSTIINEIRHLKRPDTNDILTSDLKEELTNIVFSSNYIEIDSRAEPRRDEENLQEDV